jgi:hypothetical protein
VLMRPSANSTGYLSEVGIVKIEGTDQKLVNPRYSRFDMYAFHKTIVPAEVADIDDMNLTTISYELPQYTLT